MKAKDAQTVLKSCQAKNIFQPGVLPVIYINYHGRTWQGLFLTFIKLACMLNDGLHGKIGFYRLIVLEFDITNEVMQNLSIKFRQSPITSEKHG